MGSLDPRLAHAGGARATGSGALRSSATLRIRLNALRRPHLSAGRAGARLLAPTHQHDGGHGAEKGDDSVDVVSSVPASGTTIESVKFSDFPCSPTILPGSIVDRCSCFIIYRLIFDKPINNTILIIFFLTLGVTLHGLSKDKDVKILESESK